ncbi:hypothetical protein JGI7_01355 [Candidatus Kryptonium thompsonii]|jgi:hypothetical protein|uniref:DUF305 domain-containing protein n=1 Tax=Candidatus Kryptonium thompsonii TaxID=1633631 RepID=A0A0P1MEJ7_9BACT|nr:hypothetical protein [Candidatus Kryptonium thompsoni]CUS80130.1 hypothetical protein JGI14_100731 [Candidatus Kryptonium thompsoni]CUS80669.1 hypothetical protein JGI15_10093 [Candidatus Kryptonium thompsoni]CUS84451.1 hypothetical protein JGI10_01017 [Candidatus Kryptonium thompsoni]CUS89807.1 hypothetical protein JGI7_01355 [Candidatus Kryptonium thompsoni]CUS92654.1 hypothetical protein JGI8_01708 [Candidatus Kryptonium thompsoni]
MKSKIFLSVFVSMLLALNSVFAQQQKKAEEIFKDPKTTDEILSYIVSNHGLMMKLLDKAMADEHARDMIAEHVMSYAEKDTAMGESMCKMMMGSKKMMEMMKKMEQEKEGMMEKKEEMKKEEHKHKEHMH